MTGPLSIDPGDAAACDQLAAAARDATIVEIVRARLVRDSANTRPQALAALTLLYRTQPPEVLAALAADALLRLVEGGQS